MTNSTFSPVTLGSLVHKCGEQYLLAVGRAYISEYQDFDDEPEEVRRWIRENALKLFRQEMVRSVKELDDRGRTAIPPAPALT